MAIKTPICARITIPKDRLTIFTSVTKEQALEETVLTSHSILRFTRLLSTRWWLLVRIESPVPMPPKANSQK